MVVCVIICTLLPSPGAWAQDSVATPTAEADGATAQALAPPDASPELAQQLADKYSPILNIKVQPSECSTAGEQYLPVPVDVVLGDPQVRLMQRVQENGGTVTREVMTAPTAADLFGLDDSYYLDFPGNSRLPGCDYEEWSRARYAELGTEPAVYARVAIEPDRPGEIALQYWLYWVYNHFNNLHESDWEMIQLTFEADTIEEALTQDPSQVSFAQHGGGESAEWDADKITRDGNHLSIFSASGSHASYYDSAVWIGWGANGSGFGCDQIDPESTTLTTPTRVILMPSDTSGLTADDPLAWLGFEGRWGQYQSWEFNGPFGPNAGNKWATSLSWTDDIRPLSLAIPHHETIGPGPSGLFCDISSMAGTGAALIPMVNPWITTAVGIVALGAIAWFAFWARSQVGRAIRQYVSHPGHYLPLSLWLLIVAAIANALTTGLSRLLDDQPATMDQFGDVASFGAGSFQQFLLTLFVAPIAMVLTVRFHYQEKAPLLETWRGTLPKWWVLWRVNLLNSVIVFLLTLSIVGIPLAVYRNVQWFWSSQSAILNDAPVMEARHQSRRLSKGHWWSTLRMAILVWVVSGIPGPIIGMLLFVTSLVSIETAGLISGLFYAVCYPIAIIASTLHYLELREEKIADGTLHAHPQRERWWRRTPARSSGTSPEAAGDAQPAV